MSDTVTQFPCTVPAGTPKAAPLTFQCQLGTTVVDSIEVEVPPGCNGSVGFYVASSGQQVIPFRAGATPSWLVTNGRTVSWSLADQPDSGDWQLVAYNTGANPHTLTARFTTRKVSEAPEVPPVTVAAIEGA